MKLWLDTANIDENKMGMSWGAISGVTTNSSLVAKEGFKVPFKKVVRDIVQIFRNYDEIKTQLIAASIRNPIHVIEAAKAGADIATMPFSIVEQMLEHPLTDIGIKRFLDDWEKSGISFG